MKSLYTLAAIATALIAPSAFGQDLAYVSPAYRHFLTSPYSFRTYSNLGSGRSWGYDTPFESGRFYQTPGYYHEEIGPGGRWSYEVAPRVEGYVAPRPLVVVPPVYALPYSYRC